MATEKSARKGGRQHHGNTTLDLPPDLYELYKSDLEESYTWHKNMIQWIRRYWAEQWSKYKFVTPEYAEKNVIKRPWGDILYKNLAPNTKVEAISQKFYPCMVQGPQFDNADPSSLQWCREDDVLKQNFQYAKESAAKKKRHSDSTSTQVNLLQGPMAPVKPIRMSLATSMASMGFSPMLQLKGPQLTNQLMMRTLL